MMIRKRGIQLSYSVVLMISSGIDISSFKTINFVSDLDYLGTHLNVFQKFLEVRQEPRATIQLEITNISTN